MRTDDDSTPASFELPPGHAYLANLSALWASDAELAAAIEAGGEDDTLPVRPSDAGDPTATATADDGTIVSLASPTDPRREAAEACDAADLAAAGIVLLFGFGLGYAAEAAFDRTGGAKGETRLIVFESDPATIRTACWHRDLSPLLSSGRVQFVTREDKAAVFAALQSHSAAFALGAAVLAHPPSVRLRPHFFEQCRRHVEGFAAYSRTTIHTAVLNGRATCENLARNLPWYVAAPGVGRLKDAYVGKPAVVVSAGPSLRKNGHLLKGVGDRAVVIAVQTTLRPLLAMGVTPRFVTSLDYHAISTRFYEGLPADLTTELVAEPKATDAIFGLHPGPLTLLGNDFADGLLREMRLDRPRLPAGATVAHLAWTLAEHLGCDPVIFVGQDLAFSDGLCYAPGTSYDDVWRPELGRFCTGEMKQWEQIARDRAILRRVPAHGGGTVYTEQRLYAYLQQFERDFLAGRRTVIDATEGGADKRGATAMPLADALSQYCNQSVGDGPPPHGGLDFGRLAEATECLRRRREEADEIGRVAAATAPLLAEVRDHPADPRRVNHCIAGIDALRAEMNAVGRTYDLVVNMTQKTELDRFRADRALAAAGVAGAERQRRQVARDVENVRAVADAALAFGVLVDDAVARIECFLSERSAGDEESRLAA